MQLINDTKAESSIFVLVTDMLALTASNYMAETNQGLPPNKDALNTRLKPSRKLPRREFAVTAENGFMLQGRRIDWRLSNRRHSMTHADHLHRKTSSRIPSDEVQHWADSENELTFALNGLAYHYFREPKNEATGQTMADVTHQYQIVTTKPHAKYSFGSRHDTNQMMTTAGRHNTQFLPFNKETVN